MLCHFDIMRVSLGGPVFDLDKLSWLNALWIRENFTLEELADRMIAWAYNRENLLRVLPHLQPRMERLSDFAPAAAYLAAGMLPLTEQSFAEVQIEREALVQLLQFAQWRLEGVSPWERDAIFAAMKRLADQMGLKIRDFLAPLFIAIAGTAASISSKMTAREWTNWNWNESRIRSTPTGSKHPGRKMGLGIPFLLQSLEIAGGSYELRSRKGEGTSLSFRFPADGIDTPPMGDLAGLFLSAMCFDGDYELKVRGGLQPAMSSTRSGDPRSSALSGT